jgi:electron transport complex protein RnfA
MIKELLMILLTSAMINNIVLSYFLGLCPLMGTSKKIGTAAGMGMAVIIVVTLASAINGAIYEFILLPYKLAFLQTVIFIFVIIAIIKLIAFIMKKLLKKSYQAIGIYFPVIITNCVILGAVLINVRQTDGVLNHTVNGFALALGFALVLVILAGIRERIAYNDIPESFKGLPILLLIIGLMSMAFFGFSVLL